MLWGDLCNPATARLNRLPSHCALHAAWPRDCAASLLAERAERSL